MGKIETELGRDEWRAWDMQEEVMVQSILIAKDKDAERWAIEQDLGSLTSIITLCQHECEVQW